MELLKWINPTLKLETTATTKLCSMFSCKEVICIIPYLNPFSPSKLTNVPLHHWGSQDSALPHLCHWTHISGALLELSTRYFVAPHSLALYGIPFLLNCGSSTSDSPEGKNTSNHYQWENLPELCFAMLLLCSYTFMAAIVGRIKLEYFILLWMSALEMFNISLFKAKGRKENKSRNGRSLCQGQT